MIVQRRGDDAYETPMYEGAGRIGVDWYFRDSTRLAVNTMVYHLEPGAEEGEHLHLHGDDASCSTDDADELYLVISGEVVMTVEGESTVLGPGDAAYAPTASRHGVRNVSSHPAELVLLWGRPQV
jgi:mannose-6-phosphate isomerase-like protein (cupin superfamily)